MSDKKPFKDTKFWKFVTEKVKPIAGDVLEIVGDVTGVGAVEKVGELLNNRKEGDAQMQALSIEFELKKLEFEIEFQKLEMEQFKAEVADRDGARSREVEYMKANGGKRDWLMGAAVITALAMYIGAFAFLAFGPVVPQEKKDLFNMGVGQVFTFAGMAFAYYLGTTKTSRMKDETISKMK
jgi:hypothetical protein